MDYDACGNMVYQEDNGEGLKKQMRYDAFNRISEVRDPDSGRLIGEYHYDDGGFRVRKLARRMMEGEEKLVEVLYPSMYFGIETQRTYEGQEIPDTSYAVNNIYVNGVRVAAVIPSGAARYYHTDQVDSVKVVTDDTGMPVSRFEYLPYGETWVEETADDVDEEHNPKFNSQELDRETGYYYYNARHYDAGISRFVTPDTVIDGEMSTQGWNRYAYVHNNPIRYKDPTGHSATMQGLNGNQIRQTEPNNQTRGERIGGLLIEQNTVDGKRNLVTQMKIPGGSNLTAIAEGLNKYYKTDIYTADNIAGMNNIKDKNKIRAGDSLNVDPAEYLWDKKFNPKDTNYVPRFWENLGRDEGMKAMGDAISGAPDGISLGHNLLEVGTQVLHDKIEGIAPLRNSWSNWKENYELETHDEILRQNYNNDAVMEKADRIEMYKETIRQYWRDTEYLPDKNWR